MVFVEDYTFVDAFYWTVVTSTTVGYGDMSPGLSSTKAFGMFYLVIAVGFMGNFLGQIGSLLTSGGDEKLDAILSKKLDIDALLQLDTDGSGEVSEMEYLVAMLTRMEYVTEDQIENILKSFRTLDVTGSGTLSVQDLLEALKKRPESSIRKPMPPPPLPLSESPSRTPPSPPPPSDDQEVVTLASVREKYGAGSEEYKAAAAEMAP